MRCDFDVCTPTESTLLRLNDPRLDEEFARVFNEHVEGFGGKSYRKGKRNKDKGMLWRQRLEEKQRMDAAGSRGASAPSKKKRKKKRRKAYESFVDI